MQARRLILAAGVVILAGLTAFTGCATKKYVHEELASLDQKVEGVETSIEENQKRIKEHDERLETIGSLITQHDAQFKSVDGKIEEVKKFAQGKLIFKETLRNKEAKFKVDSFELGPEAQAILDKFVEVLIAQDKGVYLEIQGHTDTTGLESWNLLLGKKRAEAVMDYLYKRHHIPLHRMQVISYGSSAPVAENSNREGRAQNRRVEILVYE
ncbi:MAG: OmpA family protein [Acidobacteriota bacterium]|nr:OmpA family protein [Acidobacteriota bacterium]